MALWLAYCAAAGWGCSQQTIESATHDTARNAQIVAREVNRAKKKAEPQLKQLEIGARVQAALKANENLPLSIRVDADPDAMGVKLRGTVKTEAQKQLAEKIARETLGSGKRVQNDLKVDDS
jgi:osmotically-inducible protein OsmY